MVSLNNKPHSSIQNSPTTCPYRSNTHYDHYNEISESCQSPHTVQDWDGTHICCSSGPLFQPQCPQTIPLHETGSPTGTRSTVVHDNSVAMATPLPAWLWDPLIVDIQCMNSNPSLSARLINEQLSIRFFCWRLLTTTSTEVLHRNWRPSTGVEQRGQAMWHTN